MLLGEVEKCFIHKDWGKCNFPQNQPMRADDLIVLLFSVVPSLASLAPDRQSMLFKLIKLKNKLFEIQQIFYLINCS